MKENKNTKLAVMGSLTITMSLLLMNVGRLEGIVPDVVVRIIGVLTMIATALCVFFTVRQLANNSKNNDGNNKHSEEKE